MIGSNQESNSIVNISLLRDQTVLLDINLPWNRSCVNATSSDGILPFAHRKDVFPKKFNGDNLCWKNALNASRSRA